MIDKEGAVRGEGNLGPLRGRACMKVVTANPPQRPATSAMDVRSWSFSSTTLGKSANMAIETAMETALCRHGLNDACAR